MHHVVNHARRTDKFPRWNLGEQKQEELCDRLTVGPFYLVKPYILFKLVSLSPCACLRLAKSMSAISGGLWRTLEILVGLVLSKVRHRGSEIRSRRALAVPLRFGNGCHLGAAAWMDTPTSAGKSKKFTVSALVSATWQIVKPHWLLHAGHAALFLIFHVCSWPCSLAIFRCVCYLNGCPRANEMLSWNHRVGAWNEVVAT